MKNAIIGVFVSICVLLTTVTIFSIQTNAGIKEQIDVALDTAIYSTQRVFHDGRLKPKSDEEYLEEFNKNLKVLIGDRKRDDVVYQVDVYGIDREKGLLDLQVRAKYKNMIGQWREVKQRKTMIIEVIDQ